MVKGISLIASILLHATIIVAVCGLATRENHEADADVGIEPIALEFVDVTIEPPTRIVRDDIAVSDTEVEVAKEVEIVKEAEIAKEVEIAKETEIAKEEALDRGEEVAEVEDTHAEPIAIIKPKYPRRARQRGIEGDVRVKVLIAADATIRDVAVESSSGSSELDNAALEAARGTKFNSASHAGLPIEGEAVLTFNFRLRH